MFNRKFFFFKKKMNNNNNNNRINYNVFPQINGIENIRRRIFRVVNNINNEVNPFETHLALPNAMDRFFRINFVNNNSSARSK